jgi:diaminohydroxyphosphoribosylaminopyrimidine deaminase/5-amino-6-(5-phosphoribosylamino)uracil reductase
MLSQDHSEYMQKALMLAKKGVGRTAPNPPVGAVIVREGVIVGEGFHPRAGEPHAEIFALKDAGAQAYGATIYVTLEPCSHFGKTPPCADALIDAGIKQVFVGVVDPNPKVAGRGIERLQAAGIKVFTGLLQNECQQLLAPFRKLISTGMPYTIYKSAMTCDGNIATSSGDSKWVSGEQSRARVHRLRDRVEAIMVGSETAIKDDPQLNTRLADGQGRDPLRIVVDSRLRLSPDCRMLRQKSQAGTLIATISNDQKKIAALEVAGAEVLVLPAEDGHVSLVKLWRELGRRDVQQLLLEGGAHLATAALTQGLIDRLMLFIAPKLLVGRSPFGIFAGQGCARMSDSTTLKNISYEQIEDDLLLTGDVVSCSPD